MRKLFGVALLVTAMTCATYAGVMQNAGPENPPNSEPGVIQNGVDASSENQAIEITLGLLQSIVPALF